MWQNPKLKNKTADQIIQNSQEAWKRKYGKFPGESAEQGESSRAAEMTDVRKRAEKNITDFRARVEDIKERLNTGHLGKALQQREEAKALAGQQALSGMESSKAVEEKVQLMDHMRRAAKFAQQVRRRRTG